MPSGKKIVGILLKVIVSGSLLTILLINVDRTKLAANLASVHIGLFLGVAFFYAFCQVVSAFRWRILLAVSNVKVSMVRLFTFNMVGMFFNNFLPTAIGGDVVRSYDLYRHTRQGKVAVASVFMDRFTGFSALLGVAAAAAVLGHRHVGDSRITWLVLGIFIIYGIVVFFLFWERGVRRVVGFLGMAGFEGLQRKVEGVYSVISEYRSARRSIVKAVILSFVLQILVIIAFYLLSLAMHLSIAVRYFFIFCPIIWASSMIPSLGGLGIREYTAVYFFTRVGVDHSEAVGLAFMWAILLILLSLVGGVIFMFRRTAGGGETWKPMDVSDPSSVSEPAEGDGR